MSTKKTFLLFLIFRHSLSWHSSLLLPLRPTLESPCITELYTMLLQFTMLPPLHMGIHPQLLLMVIQLLLLPMAILPLHLAMDTQHLPLLMSILPQLPLTDIQHLLLLMGTLNQPMGILPLTMDPILHTTVQLLT